MPPSFNDSSTTTQPYFILRGPTITDAELSVIRCSTIVGTITIDGMRVPQVMQFFHAKGVGQHLKYLSISKYCLKLCMLYHWLKMHEWPIETATKSSPATTQALREARCDDRRLLERVSAAREELRSLEEYQNTCAYLRKYFGKRLSIDQEAWLKAGGKELTLAKMVEEIIQNYAYMVEHCDVARKLSNTANTDTGIAGRVPRGLTFMHRGSIRGFMESYEAIARSTAEFVPVAAQENLGCSW